MKEKLELNGLDKIQRKRYEDRAKTADLPIAQVTAIECPGKYSKETKKAWDAIVPGLLGLKIISEVDLPSLGMMFDAYESYIRYRNREKELQAAVDWDSEKSVKILTKAASLRRGAFEDFVKLASRFGICPTERARLALNSFEEPKKDPLDLIVGGSN
jgi:phage terminase small subunit